MSNIKTIRVVCAIMLNQDGEILISRRREGRVRSGYWEFPGGKIHSNESPERAITREINEEMSIDVIPERIVGTYIHEYPDIKVQLIGLLCNYRSVPNYSADHDAILWVKRSELKNQHLSEADLKLWALIESENKL